MDADEGSSRLSAVLYWALAVFLMGFGLVGIFSIGLPFLSLGIALAVLSPVRHRPASFWPVIAAVLAFFVGYVLVAPLGCTATPTLAGSGAQSSTACQGVLFRYSSELLWPAVLAGIALALLVGRATRAVLLRKASRSPSAGAVSP